MTVSTARRTRRTASRPLTTTCSRPRPSVSGASRRAIVVDLVERQVDRRPQVEHHPVPLQPAPVAGAGPGRRGSRRGSRRARSPPRAARRRGRPRRAPGVRSRTSATATSRSSDGFVAADAVEHVHVARSTAGGVIRKFDSRHICSRRAIIGCSPRNLTSSSKRAASAARRPRRARRHPVRPHAVVAGSPEREHIRVRRPGVRRDHGDAPHGAGSDAASARPTRRPARRRRRLVGRERQVEVDDDRVGRLRPPRRSPRPRAPGASSSAIDATGEDVDRAIVARVLRPQHRSPTVRRAGRRGRGCCSTGGSSPRAAGTGRRARGEQVVVGEDRHERERAGDQLVDHARRGRRPARRGRGELAASRRRPRRGRVR